MKNGEAMDFTEDQFTHQGKDVAWLCIKLRQEGYGFRLLNAGPEGTPGERAVSSGQSEETVEWLNEVIRQTDFFDALTAVKKDLVLGDEIKKLRDRTAGARKRPFTDLEPGDQAAVTRLNRLAMEAAHPRETPCIGYRLVALFGTMTGDHLVKEFATSGEFKKELQEKGGETAWAMLIRSDEGKLIEKYHSRLGNRSKIGLVETEPVNMRVTPCGLNPRQAALREAAIEHFKTHKAKSYMAEQAKYVNMSQQVGESIKWLLDQEGKAPANMPLEEIVEYRLRTETYLRWLEATCTQLRDSLVMLGEIEDAAFTSTRQDAAVVPVP